MQIVVIARNPMGHSFVTQAGRFWGRDPKVVEVVDVKAGEYVKKIDEHGNLLPVHDGNGNDIVNWCEDGDDPPAVSVTATNPTTKREEQRLVQDPERIGRKSYERLMTDGRITVKQTDTVSQDAADAAVSAARAEVQRQANEILELKSKVARLESGKALKEALAENAELRALIEAQTAPSKTMGKRAAKEAAAGG